MKRSERMSVARDTVEVVKRGYYDVNGKRVDIARSVNDCLTATRMIDANELYSIRDSLVHRPGQHTTEIEVVNETTLAGLQRLASSPTIDRIGILNFASAKNPGGGFLNGSQAQEESLARSSALHASLIRVFHFYKQHRESPPCLYSDNMIFSPECPVFRDDEGEFLQQPLLASFITSPAPNAGATADNRPHELPMIPQALKARSELVIALAASQGISTLILGAWGCGVFRNDPSIVAQSFASHIHGQWAGRFRKIVFSVLDKSEANDTFQAFESVFKKAA